MFGKKPTREDLENAIGKTVYAGSMQEAGCTTIFAGDKALEFDLHNQEDVERAWDFVQEYKVLLIDQIRAKLFGES